MYVATRRWVSACGQCVTWYLHCKNLYIVLVIHIKFFFVFSLVISTLLQQLGIYYGVCFRATCIVKSLLLPVEWESCYLSGRVLRMAILAVLISRFWKIDRSLIYQSFCTTCLPRSWVTQSHCCSILEQQIFAFFVSFLKILHIAQKFGNCSMFLVEELFIPTPLVDFFGQSLYITSIGRHANFEKRS